MMMQAAPIVRVAVEAALPSELPRLVEGLRLLNRADPFLEVSLQVKGEYVLGAAGLCLSVAFALSLDPRTLHKRVPSQLPGS